MRSIYSTGNHTVDEVGKIHMTGNIIPSTWYRTIVKENGKPHWLAINILADIVYWYRPTEIRHEQTGQLIEFRKKFKSDLLQRSYAQLAEQFGISKREAQRAIVFLEELKLVKRIFRTIEMGDTKLNNVLYIKLDVDQLKAVTFPTETLLPNLETPLTKNGNTLLPNLETPITNFGKTNTKNTNIDYDIDYLPSSEEDFDEDEILRKKNKTLEIIRENISYESLIELYPIDKDQIDEYVDLMTDIYLQEGGTVRINSQEKPIEVVKSQFMKLNKSHIEYVLLSYRENTTKIRNIRNHILTTLYNAPMTMNQYYSALVNHDLYGDERR